MESIQAINNEIREVSAKICIAQSRAEEAKLNAEHQKHILLEVEAEVAEKEKINKMFEYIQSLDVSKIKTTTLNTTRLPEAIEIIRNLRDEANQCNRYVYDCQQILTQYENDFAKYDEEVKTLKEYLQGLSIQLKFKIEHEKQLLDQLLQSNQDLMRMYQPHENNQASDSGVTNAIDAAGACACACACACAN